jgi:hypothetical protein
MVVGIAFLFLIGVFLYIGLQKIPVATRQPAHELTPKEIQETEYERLDQAYKMDLTAVRRKILSHNYTSYNVARSGPEFRLMLDFLYACDWGCEKIIQVEINPLETRNGFKANVTCTQGEFWRVRYLWTTGELSVDGKACGRL